MSHPPAATDLAPHDPADPLDPPDAEDGRRRRARERRDATRQALVRAATTAFAGQGFEAATPAEIATLAGVTRATFYQHFASKADAFTAVLDDLVERLGRAVRGVDLAPDAAPPEAQLTSNLLRVLDILLEDRELARVLLVEAAGREAVVHGRVEDFYAFVRAMIREALLDGAAVGLVRPVVADIAAHALLGAVRAVVTARLARADGEIDAAERATIARELLACCLCGVASDGLRAAVLTDGEGPGC